MGCLLSQSFGTAWDRVKLLKDKDFCSLGGAACHKRFSSLGQRKLLKLKNKMVVCPKTINILILIIIIILK